jgi:hypothetical protein
MWNLNGDDIKKAKDALESRRATLKVEYEEEPSGSTPTGDIDGSSASPSIPVDPKATTPPGSEAAPEKAAEKEPSSENGVTEIKVAEKPAENSSEKENKPAGEAAPMEQKGSRWRMRLGTLSETEAAD